MGKDQELLEAARNGNVPVVDKILGQRAKRSGPLASLRRGPGANVQDSSGYSALHHAALNGHKEVVKLLLQHEASTNIVDAKGSSPLHLAAWSGNSEIVRLILSQGPSVPNVNLTTKDNETALHCAAQYGHTEVVAQLLQAGCDPSIRNSRGESALDLAAQYGRLETVELLVRTHPELIESLRSSSSSLIFPHTPLHLASRNGHRACVEVLLAAGVAVNTRTSAGTALHEAALCGKMEVVRALLDRGVDLTINDSHHNTVLDLLGQFPTHVNQDIIALIKRYRSSCGTESSDADSENLPPIPVHQGSDSLGSPYENVRPGDELSPGDGSSPSRWQLYHKPRHDDRRISANSAISFEEELYEGAWRQLEGSEERSEPSSSLFDSVFMSMSDTLNSINTLASSDQTPEDRPYHTTLITTPSPDTLRGSDSGLYQTPPTPRGLGGEPAGYASEDQLSLQLPSGYGCRESDQLSVSSSSSVGGRSPRERRCVPVDSSGIYLPMAPLSSSLNSPASSTKVSNGGMPSLQPTPPKKPPRRNLSVSPTHVQSQLALSAGSEPAAGNYEYLFLARSGGSHHQLRHCSRSVDQYVEMRARCDSDSAATLAEDGPVEPVALTWTGLDNRPVRVTNPRRKLRRHAHEAAAQEGGGSPCSEPSRSAHGSSHESLAPAAEAADKRPRRVRMLLPTSPTHYAQPPTPDHPPPSAIHAENSIHERIRPLSQVYKRRSRDMETETDEELLQFPAGGSLEASSGSLSSVSLSDKSMSTDNVEEYFGDVPFAGLLKGSVSAAERPRTLRRLKNVYSPGGGGGGGVMGTGADVAGEQRTSEPLDDPGRGGGLRQPHDGADNGLGALMSPFDEQQEWAKISEIMASFGSGIVRESVFVTEFEKEFQTRLGLNSDTGSPCVVTLVGQWLAKLNLADYESLFVNYGYDDLEFINGVLEESDLRDMGIGSEEEVRCIMEAASLLANRVEKRPASASQSVDEWLKAIHLQGYAELFRRHLYTDMERVRRVWEVELAAVLEIQKPGHRKRILASVTGGTTSLPPPATNGNPPPNLLHLNKDLNTLKNNIKQLKEEIREKLPETTVHNNGVTTPTSTSTTGTTGMTGTTGTLKHRKNRPAPPPPQRPANPTTHNGSTSAQLSEPLEIRAPNELLFGVSSTLKTQWRHQPKDLVTGCVTYVANYLGSTVVKELQGMESTKKSIHKLKKINRDPRGSPDISLAISYRGVRFLNAVTDEPICEHEIRNIHCACQDADDLTHFAYITKDHASKTHFCHVFCVPTMDQATEIILTLGQAFEVAYQIALRDKLGSGQPIRSQSAGQMAPNNGGGTRAANSVVKPSEQQQQQPNNNEQPSNGRSKSRSKSITNPFVSSPSKASANNSHSNNSTSNNVNHPRSGGGGGGTTVRMLASHGRSHSEHDIKINGNNQLKLAPAPVDDIGIGVKDMKAGSRAPIALSEEL